MAGVGAGKYWVMVEQVVRVLEMNAEVWSGQYGRGREVFV